MSIIKYIRKSVKSIVRWAVNDYESKNYADDTSIPIAGGSHSKASTGTSGIGTNGMNFIVYPATGGSAVNCSKNNLAPSSKRRLIPTAWFVISGCLF